MLTPKVERLPPVTVEFLRIVRGVETVRLQCEGCNAVHAVAWADLGLPDDSPFPPAGKTWRCSRCGGTEIIATPQWPVEPKREGVAPPETAIPHDLRNVMTEAPGAITPELRERLAAMLARLGPSEG